MAKFTKRIMAPGTYSVPDKKGGRRSEFISKSRIQEWVNNFSKMTSSGLQIPAPWHHDPDSAPIRSTADKTDTNSKDNAGWWRRLWVEDDGSLYGELEVPNRSDAAKVGKTVVEVSPLVMRDWVDGASNKYDGESCTHIALVTHPIVPNQENFKPVKETSIALSLSSLISTQDITGDSPPEDDDLALADSMEESEDDVSQVNAKGASLSQALPILRKLGLALPKDTDESNFAERIIVAAVALAHKQSMTDDDSELDDAPSRSKEQPSPIAMSQETKLTKQQEGMLTFSQNLIRKDYENRVKELIRSGRITPKYAEEQLAPLLENLKIEFSSEGELVPGPLDAILAACEAIPAGACLTNQTQTSAHRNAKGTAPDGSRVSFAFVEETRPDDDDSSMSDEDVINSVLQHSSL